MKIELFILGLCVAFVLSFLINQLDKVKQHLILSGMCEWCNVYIAKEDRIKRYQTNGGSVMCPHCWEYTRVQENISIEKWELKAVSSED